jgi:hypothetical protein
MRLPNLFFVFLAFLASGTSSLMQEVQPVTCPAIVSDALAAVDSLCAETGRNQACYGNVTLTAEPQPDVEDFVFDVPGDIANVADMQSLTLSNMDESVSGWGIALMRLQADLPDTLPGQNVTVLLFGDVDVEDAGGDTPMQAFTFRSGIGDAPCEAAPDSGILIQTPEGAAEVTLMVNGAKITLGSTIYLQAVAGEAMTIAVIEGQITVTAFDTTVSVPAGMTASVPVDENRVVSGPPNEAETSLVGLVEDLAPVLAVLPEPIVSPVSSESTSSETTVPNQQSCTVTAAGNVNLRSGPGTVYGRSGGITAGSSENPVGQAVGVDGYTWWQLSNGSWVRSDVVNAAGDCDKLPSVTDIPPTPTPAPVQNTQVGGGNNNGTVVLDCATTVVNAGKLTIGGGTLDITAPPGWTTCEAALAAGPGVWYATISGNGPTPTDYRSGNCYWDARYDQWGIHTEADVVLTPGEYTYTITFPDGHSHSCTIIAQ